MMTEAEVSLRVAFHYIENGLSNADVRVAIDGAQIRTVKMVHFEIDQFLKDHGWIKNDGTQGWQGTYSRVGQKNNLIIHSSPGMGDVVVNLIDGKTLWVESKKGTLKRSKSSAEYRLLREAIGQQMTKEEVSDTDIIAVAVPKSEKTLDLITRWVKAPLICKAGIVFLTVEQSGKVTIHSNNAT